MKNSILTVICTIALATFASCDKKADKSNEAEHVHQEGEATHEHDSIGSPHSEHDHKEGDDHSGHDHETK